MKRQVSRTTTSSAHASFGAWAGTKAEFDQTIRRLQERTIPQSQVQLSLQRATGTEEEISSDALVDALPKKGPFQLKLRLIGSDRRLEVRFGTSLSVLPEGQDQGGDEHGEVEYVELRGNSITAEAATEPEAQQLVEEAVGVLASGFPRWGKLRERTHWSMLRLENLAALVLIVFSVGLGQVAAWPIGFFFGMLLSFGLLFIGLEVVDVMFPPFEIHHGRPRWRRRWWPLALVASGPVLMAVSLRILVALSEQS